MRVPKNVQKLVWWAKVDGEKDKKRLITQIFNYGDVAAIRWMRKTYPGRIIKACVRNPLPGEWERRSLRFAEILYNVRLTKTQKEKALRNLKTLRLERKSTS
jgi:hypothetical protein